MKLYSIKNDLTGYFNPPFVARDDVDAKEIVRNAVITGRDISLLVELENLHLYDVGFFDAETGVFDGDCQCCILHLDALSLPEHIEKMIAKIKEVKEKK